MKNKPIFWFYLILLVVSFIAYIFLYKFIFYDCDYIIQAGYSQEIGFGMALILFIMFGMVLFSCVGELIKLCKSSGSPDDK